MLDETPIVLFDGTCSLCDRTIQFVLDHERDHDLRFVALQSSLAEQLLVRACGEAKARSLLRGANGGGDPDSIVVIEGARAFLYSDGALRIARHLRAPWGWLRAFTIVPRALRDVVYRLIARNRYRWFGRVENCRIPTEDQRARFLDSDGPAHAAD